MSNKSAILAILFILFFVTIVSAQTSIKAEVDKASVTTDDVITYKLTIASTEKMISQPKFPKFEGFSVLSQAQSSAISFAKNNIETSLTYVFVLAPLEAGKFTIKPSKIQLQGKAYSTQSFEIEVIKGKAQPKPRPEQKSSQPESIQPESEEPQYTL